MTKVEAYKAVIAGEVTEDVVAKFEEMLAAHEVETEKRREKAAEKRAEKLAGEKGLEDAIVALITERGEATASDMKEAVDGIESPQKATAVAKRLVGAGTLIVEDGKGKSGKVKVYKLA